MQHCNSCGTRLVARAKYCVGCGTNLRRERGVNGAVFAGIGAVIFVVALVVVGIALLPFLLFFIACASGECM